MRRGPAIGIDLGTCYSSVALWRNGNLVFEATIPSVVAFTDTDNYLVGEPAVEYANANCSPNVIYHVKRLIGRPFNDSFIQREIRLWPFELFSNYEGRPMISIQHKGKGRRYSGEQITSFVLITLVRMAESHAGCTINDVVIAVPAHFNSFQRQATLDAGKLAGLNVKQLISETLATGLACCSNKNAGNFLIFDLGGGYFDVSLLTIKKDSIEVKATAGDPYLGGEDFIERIMKYVLEEFRRKHRRELYRTPENLRKLRIACRAAVRVLSSEDEATIDIVPSGGTCYTLAITRHIFDELTADLCRKCIDLVEKCLRDSKIDKPSVNFVLLVGGSARIPRIQYLLDNFFNGNKPLTVIKTEEVAYGASVQAAILSERSDQRIRDIYLLDRTTSSFGIGVLENIMDVVIPRNTAFPAKMTWTVTKHEYGPWSKIWIYEGERLHVDNCNLLGVDIYDGRLVDVIFQIDVNGILNVMAQEELFGQPKTIKITNSKDELHRKIVWLIDLEKKRRPAYGVKKHNERCKAMLDAVCYYLYNIVKFKMHEPKLADSDKEKILNKIMQPREQENSTPEAEADEICRKMYEILEILLKADSYQVECEEKKAQSKNSLERYCLRLRRTINEKGNASKLPSADKKKLEDEIVEMIHWLGTDRHAEALQYDEKLKELDSLYNYQLELEKKAQLRNSLEKYCYSLRRTINEETVGRLGSASKKRLEDVIEKMIRWMENNELAETWEYNEKQMELESLYNRWLEPAGIMGLLLGCLKGCLWFNIYLATRIRFDFFHPQNLLDGK